MSEIVTVILWDGELHSECIKARDRVVDGQIGGEVRALRDIRIEGAPGRWFVVADAVRYQP